MEANERDNETADDPIFGTTALGIFLNILFVIFLVSLFFFVTAKDPSQEVKTRPPGPENFPEIFNVDPVDGLASISAQQHRTASVPPEETARIVALPPFSEGVFPCSNCHDGMETDETVRQVGEPHEDIVLNHGDPKERWCLDCHDAKNRDVLRLNHGTSVPFEESYRLCGQCHGNVYRDWKRGVHGKRVGFWNGPKIYLLCVHCHNPHSPHFKPISPLPPPDEPFASHYQPGKEKHEERPKTHE